MLRNALLAVLTLLLAKQSYSQHADLGTGVLKNQIWWLNWAGVTVSDGATKTFLTNDSLTITVTFSNATTREPVPAAMNTYFGAVLHLLYDFSDPSILPSLYDGPIQGGIITFTMTISASRNGTPVSFYLVSADAEASRVDEVTTLQTNGSAWQTMSLFRNSTQTTDPLSGCGTKTVAISATYGGNYQQGQNPIVTTRSPGTTSLTLDVSFDHGARAGGMSQAFGILQSDDRGDLPASYGFAQHQLLYTLKNPCNYLAPLPSLAQNVDLMIGSVPGDADPIQYTDDNAIGVDEEGVSTFPAYDGNGSYTINMPVANNTGAIAWLTGWFDYNRDGAFQPVEATTIPIPSHATSASLVWTGLPQYLPQGSATGYGFRFRLSSDQQATQRPTGFAKDGEVEDYLVPAETLCSTFQPGITANQSVCSGQQVPLQASGATTYNWSPATSLSDPSIANPIASPQTTTTYNLTAVNAQGCMGNAAVTITVKTVNIPPVGITPADTSVCYGDTIKLTAFGGDQYAWLSTSRQPLGTDSSLTAIVDTTTQYQVTITDQLCQYTTTLTAAVTVRPPPVLSITSSNDVNCTVVQSTLQATGAVSYQWLPADGITNLLTPNPVVAPLATTTYYVKGTDAAGCSTTDSVTVRVDNAADLNRYPVANAFTPNNDGHNDCFGLKNWGRVTTLELSVFNRHGMRVFYTTNPQDCWDGTYNGVPQPGGGYAYQIKATTTCGTVYRKGIVILVR